jgi:ubiquitin carboxyl-terminal hydrolase 16/45
MKQKNGVELMRSASERKGNEETMADGEKSTMNCSKKEDIDQIMTIAGCSDNVNPDMQFTEGECANPSLAELEHTPMVILQI